MTVRSPSALNLNTIYLSRFLPPPLKELAWQTIPLPTDSYGMLKNQRSLCRLSGRKEANLLYVFKHGRESIITV